ncbi:MAG: hypothetical protein JSS20_08395 [Proteobacteria bacterium]|nr:hypothetical protein [Pseudomonadota bacterium]
MKERVMPADLLFWLATLAFAWGLALASYRWFAIHNGWAMGEWQRHRPGLPIAIGLFSMLFAMLFAMARGGPTLIVVPMFGLVFALAWTAILRVGAQLALLLAPISLVALLVVWMSAASNVVLGNVYDAGEIALGHDASGRPAATDREGNMADADRGITRVAPRVTLPASR